MSISRVVPALRANLIWLVVCITAVTVSSFFAKDSVNAVTANFMFCLGACAAAITLAESAWIGRPEFSSVKWFVYAIAIGLAILGMESFFRGYVVLFDHGEWFTKYLSAPINILKLCALVFVLVINATIQNRGRDTRLAKTFAIGIGAATAIYAVLFFAVRAIVP